jgi:hypothetical protein
MLCCNGFRVQHVSEKGFMRWHDFFYKLFVHRGLCDCCPAGAICHMIFGSLPYIMSIVPYDRLFTSQLHQNVTNYLSFYFQYSERTLIYLCDALFLFILCILFFFGLSCLWCVFIVWQLTCTFSARSIGGSLCERRGDLKSHTKNFHNSILRQSRSWKVIRRAIYFHFQCCLVVFDKFE